MTLLGDVLVSLPITATADRVGRKWMLIVGAALMALAGAVFLSTDDFLLLLAAATVGVISPSGNEVGPFLAIEQAALAQVVTAQQRTRVFAWYSLTGSLATAFGALLCGLTVQTLQDRAGFDKLQSYRIVLWVYAGVGVLLAALFTRLSPAAEAHPPTADVSSPLPCFGGEGPGVRGHDFGSWQHPLTPAPLPGVPERGEEASPAQAEMPPRAGWLGLHRSRGVVLGLSALFALDAFAGGFVIQSAVVEWFHIRFGADAATLGVVFWAANVLAGFSALAAAAVARRVGLLRTMVYTHAPSNLLLILVPFMPNLPWAIAMLLLRFAISQMDVPARQSYTAAVVSPDERSAAAGVTGVARTAGASLSPFLVGPLLSPLASRRVGRSSSRGALKLVYDGLVYWRFRAAVPPEERRPG